MPLTTIKSSNIKDSEIKDADISPTAGITESKIAGLDANQISANAFNIGVLGFKMAVSDGLTIFNLVDGVVDEFNDESGVDTAENSNAAYDSTSDFYANQTINQPLPAPQIGRTSITSTGSGTYSVEPTTSAVDVLVVGGGGSGGAGGYNNTAGGGGGAGGLIFYEDYPVTGGSSIPVSVGAGGRSAGGGGPSGTGSSGYEPFQPERFTYSFPVMPSATVQQLYSPGEQGTDSVFNAAPALVLTAEGGGAGGGYATTVYVPWPTAENFEQTVIKGGSAGGTGSYSTEDNSESPEAEHAPTQTTNHPVPGLSNDPLPGTPINARGAFGNAGGVSTGTATNSTHCTSGGGGGAGTSGGDGIATPETGGAGGEGLNYNIADGSTPVGYAGGGGGGGADTAPPSESVPYGGGVGQTTTAQSSSPWAPISSPYSPIVAGTEGYAGTDARVNSGGGSGGGHTEGVSPNHEVGVSGIAGSGIIIVAESKGNVTQSSMTLISDTFTANSTPSTARIVIFAELPDGTSDFTVSATRDNTNFDAITLTDEGYATGSSGTKIFTGSTPLTGAAPGQPQVQLRWKVVGSSLTGNNKIHGVALQWK